MQKRTKEDILAFITKLILARTTPIISFILSSTYHAFHFILMPLFFRVSIENFQANRSAFLYWNNLFHIPATSPTLNTHKVFILSSFIFPNNGPVKSFSTRQDYSQYPTEDFADVCCFFHNRLRNLVFYVLSLYCPLSTALWILHFPLCLCTPCMAISEPYHFEMLGGI